ncbi:site-specific DNA-methyltransferase [Pseudarthrobacter psychrotolerans]|uniref:Methyltransferase n=1 Tax=Pseudarthrobacter psychrotolerans TaxID=2697569 RepID=A0A6P1NSU3_9MICC|nr:site-specific DNA-methyltransferase [Pseudarthrobacter psychrotolerans]QHK19851.1 site-specific DNA-methyltransferase [Pseudarthrobacter psychrotolerans]
MTSATNRLHVGDALITLRRFPTESVDMCLTSPPYFRLRDYDAPGQLGLEESVDIWAATLREVCREVHRVLVPTGTFWLNLGDTYTTHARQGAPPKSLALAPERLARLLQEDGWILRNKIIWAKPNPMPTSVRDRLTATHEVIYVFAKQPRYFFDLDSIRVAHVSKPGSPPGNRSRRPTAERWRGPNADSITGLVKMKARGVVGHPLGKNPGDVWTISTSAGKGSHHATFPESLASRCLQAGTPEARCVACRKPLIRAVHRLGETATRLALKPSCEHRNGTEPGIVLDPFMGSGTTAVVAERLHRQWIGVELNSDFAQEAFDRISSARASPAA